MQGIAWSGPLSSTGIRPRLPSNLPTMTFPWFVVVTTAILPLTPLTLAFGQSSVHTVHVERSGAGGFIDSKHCFGCHADIYRRYRLPGMARSFYRPTRETTVGKSGGPITYYHEPTRMHYSMSERAGNYYQQRWRVDFDGKKTDSNEFRIDFIMGSGSHARSYLHREANGALVELPLAWYSEKGGYWALNPGYDTNRIAPQRQISYDCMFCHNSYRRYRQAIAN